MTRLDCVPETYRNCEHCAHWLGGRSGAFAARAGGLVAVGQCGNEDDFAAPFADLPQGEGFVFTRPDACCEAFALHADVVADLLADKAHYRALERERRVA